VQPVTLAPRAAIRAEGGASVAFVLRGEAVERRAITTGGMDGDRVEVVAGLQPGDRVVLSPPEALTDGQLVVVR
jgi:multidrug efflux pump subunit AcrA (membrane-fusion protein)